MGPSPLARRRVGRPLSRRAHRAMHRRGGGRDHGQSGPDRKVRETPRPVPRPIIFGDSRGWIPSRGLFTRGASVFFSVRADVDDAAAHVDVIIVMVDQVERRNGRKRSDRRAEQNQARFSSRKSHHGTPIIRDTLRTGSSRNTGVGAACAAAPI